MAKSKKMARSKKQTWDDLSAGRKAAVLATGTVQFGLAAAAWKDLAGRPASGVRGPKPLWAAIIAVNWIGPLAYFLRGRRQ